MTSKRKISNPNYQPSKIVKVTNHGENEDVDDSMTIAENECEMKSGPYTTKFTSSDLVKYYQNIDGKNDYDEILNLLNMVKDDLSIERINLYKKNDIFHLSVTVANEDDHKSLNENENLIIRSKNGIELINLKVVVHSQTFLVAIKNVSPGLQLNKNVVYVNDCKTRYNLRDLKRKTRLDGMHTNTLLATVNNENSFIDLIKNGIILKNKIYQAEPWVFKPMQCLKCGEK
ncbi:unnamed protein product [Brachionus calyciflorus]|uniref:Uncharacterized protein n=1 Tax=Brachionus calyciflorus TaxID=104777 RepID=A0A814NCE4_9BILA|nr:unnamed protein product [Brachionus calyciflorus]